MEHRDAVRLICPFRSVREPSIKMAGMNEDIYCVGDTCMAFRPVRGGLYDCALVIQAVEAAIAPD